MDETLSNMYHKAAIRAINDNVDAGNENQLISWIRQNCTYDPGMEFFLVLGIGADLADIQARQAGFKNEVDRCFSVATAKLQNF